MSQVHVLPTTLLLLSLPDNDLGSVYVCIYLLDVPYIRASICLPFAHVCCLLHSVARHSDGLTVLLILTLLSYLC